MIEATCGACGTVARIAEADVPAGAKSVTCANCKARVPLPASAAGGASKPAVPALPPSIPKVPGPKAPPIPGKPPMPGAAKPGVELADLPAPKRASPLADQPASKPAAPRSALAGAELPAPKSAAKPPAAPAGNLDLDDLMPPKAPAASPGLADLPVPKPRPSPLADLPAPKAKPSALAGLPTKDSGDADLPAPKAKSALDLGDLPAPKAKPGLDLGDLPAPKAKPGLDLGDLPAPKAKPGLDLGGDNLDIALGNAGALDLDDLPAPKSAAAPSALDDDLDLPMPAGTGGFADLPIPKTGANAADLPAPKGFFDDLPAPKKAAAGGIDLPAPKGFFDDLPQPAAAKPGGTDLPAPKGFFDDLPQPKAATPAGGGGFFDDLPAPKAAAAAKAAAGPSDAGFGGDLDLGLAGDRPLELDGGPSASASGGADLDLGIPLGEGSDFGGLDLSQPSKPSAPEEPGSPIKFKKSGAGGGAPPAPIPIVVKKRDGGGDDLKLDLADDPHDGKGAAAGSAAAKKKVAKKVALTPEQEAELRAKKQKRQKITLAAVLGLALAGAGGFYFYQKHAAAQARAEKIEDGIARAHKALREDKPNHWQKATAAANEVLEIEPKEQSAIGIAAEAAIAGALDNGLNYEQRIKQGRKLVQDGLGAGKISPELERAQALMAIAANQPDRAVDLLSKLSAAAPKDGWLQLYLGWAKLGKGDADAALKAFEQAVALEPATKLPALFGHGQAKLLKADLDGAKSDFAGVLQIDKDHIGAQVGLAQTLPPQQAAQREADLRAMLALPDIDKKDPRARTRAFTLIGDGARASGRLEIARDAYSQALKLQAADVSALTGLATVEMRDKKIQVARDLVAKALTSRADDADAQLLDAELDVAEGKLGEAETKLKKLEDRKPPLPPLQLARMHVVKGKLLDTQGKAEEAIAEYTEGAKVAGDLDLTPTMAAVTKLTELSEKAPDEATRTGYRARADELLSKLAERAKEDGETALTLGTAYLQAGDAAKAEDMLRRAVAMRDKDPESRLQLAKALSALNRTDDAVAALKDALSIDPKRGDISLELASTYQKAGRDAEAMAAYGKLLAGTDVAPVVRVKAGRYFASKGAFDKAAAQAEPILAVEPENQGGLYLKGEGLILAKNWNDARTTLIRATDLDQSDAQALDALGRAYEGGLAATNDTKFVESARHAYERATKVDAKLFHAHLALGRMLNEQQHPEEAIKALEVAATLDKSSSGVMYEMGKAYYGLRGKDARDGKLKRTGVAWFESALRSSPPLSDDDKADAYFKLGDMFFDLNNPGESARAWESATRVAEEIARNTGKAPVWLTMTWYRLGQVYEGMGNKPAQKRAWEKFIALGPADGSEKSAATYWLATEGKRF